MSEYTPTQIRVMEWAIWGEGVGASSRALAFTCAGLRRPKHFAGATPLDAGDFGRCVAVVERIPELWANEGAELRRDWPQWRPIVKQWARLVELLRIVESEDDDRKRWDMPEHVEMRRIFDARPS